jgi:hypothetical protein
VTQYYPRPSATACYHRAIKLRMLDQFSWERLAWRLDREATFYQANGLTGCAQFARDRARHSLYNAGWTSPRISAFFGEKL